MGKDAQGGRPTARLLATGLAIAVVVGSILSPSLSAQAANPSGAKLKWLPYKEAKQEAPSRVVTAYQSEPVASEAAANAVHPAQATVASDPFNDPFGDAHATPAGPPPAPILTQVPTGIPARGDFRTALQAPSPGEPPEVPKAGNPTRLAPRTGVRPAVDDSPRADRKIDFSCRSLKELTEIDQITNNIDVPSDLSPYKKRIDELGCPLGEGVLPDRMTTGWCPITYSWTASALCHKPLYFEQSHVERYGHSTGPLSQPFVSGALFFVTVPLLPYEMGLSPPHECMYSLGYYRPGSCAPYHIDPLPLSIRAGLIQAGAVVGAAAIIP